MIPTDEVRAVSQSLGVPQVQVEKDYVMGWLLWGVSQDPFLQRELVLKGGSALRKLYFSDTRFSDDLDFTTRHRIRGQVFLDRLRDLQGRVAAASAIPFALDQTRVDEKPTPDPETNALDARVYFQGFAGDASLTFRVKFDVSPYERIVLPLQEHAVIHGFSDSSSCLGAVFGYSLEEILAEKLRSWIQRTRARDLFDVAKIISSGQLPISKRSILSAFLQKTVFSDLPNVGRDELLVDEKFRTADSHWLRTIVCPANTLIIAANAWSTFTQFVNALFQPDLLGELQVRARRRVGLRLISSAVREAIIAAGHERRLIRMRYHGIDRTIEPYSFRYKVRKADGLGFEYFFGYDRTRGSKIKMFFLHEIDSVSILPQVFQPRYAVEF